MRILPLLLIILLTLRNGIEIDQPVALGVKPRRIETIPPRSSDAIGGAEFAGKTRDMSGAERQQAALSELRRGNVPDFLRNFRPVNLSHRLPDGRIISGVIWVMPDYLSIGSDQDFLRIPLTYPSATAIAKEFDLMLPTRKMVDDIYGQSDCKLDPQPLPPGRRMRSSEYYLEHQRRIEKQREGRQRCRGPAAIASRSYAAWVQASARSRGSSAGSPSP